MSGKRALIVDDSRSARVILGRMLEGFGLQADTAESAEQAFEYLQTGRPDVIFMDHLMPGMDGFAAVRVLKNNPDTATIPVLMYTSQEGELYMGQARALGAVGVLPKTVKPVDLTRLLHQLHLLPERRQERDNFGVLASSTGSHAAHQPAPAANNPAPRTDSSGEWAMRTTPVQLMAEHDAELRNYIANSLEALGRRISTDIKALAATPPLAETQQIPVQQRARWQLWALPTAAGIAALAALSVLLYMNQRVFETLESVSASNAQLATSLSAQEQQLTELKTLVRDTQLNAAAAGEPVANAASLLQTESVPYGETPFAGARLDRLRTLIEKLRTENAKGVVRVDNYVGDFCLTGNAADGYSEATDDLPARRCDLLGNPFEDSLRSAQHLSVAFANYVASVPKLTDGTLQVETSNAGRKPVSNYPVQSDALSAGEWNRAASRNNRVEYVFLPTG